MNRRKRLGYSFVRPLTALPAAAQVRLSGSPPITLDGATLAPEQQLLLALLKRRASPPVQTLTPQQARAGRRALAALLGGPPTPVGAVEDLELDTPVALSARHYSPAVRALAGARPLLVYLHGGGFLYGDLDTHDAVCRLLCTHASCHVLAIDYRLAPEHPFPAAVEDALSAFRWACENAAELGADGGRVGVGGDSAGGNLAAVAAQLAARDGGPAPALQLLIYPVTDFSTRRHSRELFGEGFVLTGEEMDWFESNYLGGVGAAAASDVRASPLLAEDLSGLAPAIVVTGGFDPLRDDGEEYAHALARAETPVVLRRFEGFMHAFISAAGISRSAREALIEVAGITRGVFETSAGRERAPTANELGRTRVRARFTRR